MSRSYQEPIMTRFFIFAIAVAVFLLAGCEMALVDDMYADRFVYVYDYSEPVPAEAGIYSTGQYYMDRLIEAERACSSTVRYTMRGVDVTCIGKELEQMLVQLYQGDLYQEQ